VSPDPKMLTKTAYTGANPLAPCVNTSAAYIEQHPAPLYVAAAPVKR